MIGATLAALTALALGPLALGSAAPPGDPPARLDVRRTSEGLVVAGVYEGPAADALAYELTVRREGPAGATTTRQAGAFEPHAGRADTLSVVRVNATDGDHVALRLVVRRGDAVVADVRREGAFPAL